MSVAFRPAGPHRSEGLMARRIEKRDALPMDADRVCADVLRDSTGFPFRDLRLTNGIEQRRLSMVDMAHDRDNRRPGLQMLLARSAGCFFEQIVSDLFDRYFHFCAIFIRNERGRFEVDGLIEGHHLTHIHQFLHDFRRTLSDQFGEVLDAHTSR